MAYKTRTTYWQCKWCGLKSKVIGIGRPAPGNCRRKPTIQGKSLPHSWVLIAKF